MARLARQYPRQTIRRADTPHRAVQRRVDIRDNIDERVMHAHDIGTLLCIPQRDHRYRACRYAVDKSLQVKAVVMNVAKLQHSSQGVFVFAAHDELCVLLTHLLCHGSFDPVYYPSDDALSLEEAIGDGGPSVDELATTMADLSRCLRGMDDRHRTVLYNALAGWRISEIAVVLNLSLYHVQRILREATALLSNHYGNRHPQAGL